MSPEHSSRLFYGLAAGRLVVHALASRFEPERQRQDAPPDGRPEPEPYRCGVPRDDEAHKARAEEKRLRKMAKRAAR